MLSIIISSYQPHYYLALEKNIAATIGIPYEMIKIDNPGKMGICEAYNRGAEKAQYDYLLFLHEDILFKTQDWGSIITDHLKDEKTGTIGLAGADYIPEVPIGWWMIKNHCYSHITHVNLIENKNHQFTFSAENGLKKVKIIDGVFMACSKNNWEKIKFDERLQGYHAYDISFSIKSNSYFNNYITNKISIQHFSQGKPSKDWMDALLLNKKRNAKYYHQKEFDRKIEFLSFAEFSKQLWHLKYPKKQQVFLLFEMINTKKLGLNNTLKALKKIVSIIFYKYEK